MPEMKKFRFSLTFIEPVERVMAAARKFAGSPDENRCCVAKALLDVTASGDAIKKAMEEDCDTKLDPYLDFWFADAVGCAEKLLQYEDVESRDLGQCLIDAESSVIKSKESVLAEIKRLGLRPQGE